MWNRTYHRGTKYRLEAYCTVQVLGGKVGWTSWTVSKNQWQTQLSHLPPHQRTLNFLTYSLFSNTYLIYDDRSPPFWSGLISFMNIKLRVWLWGMLGSWALYHDYLLLFWQSLLLVLQWMQFLSPEYSVRKIVYIILILIHSSSFRRFYLDVYWHGFNNILFGFYGIIVLFYFRWEKNLKPDKSLFYCR